MNPKKKWMEQAISLAEESAQAGDYALGAVVVKGNEQIATGSTSLKHQYDPSAHGELIAIRNAATKLESHYLKGCILYSTLEPCPMCTAAAIWAKMKGIVFGATIADAQQIGNENFSRRQITLPCREVIAQGTPRLELVEGFMQNRCKELFALTCE